MKHKKIIFSIVAVIVSSIIAVSYSFLTDRIFTLATTSASSLNITINNDINNTGIEGKEVLTPGGIKPIKYTVENSGNILTDVKEQIILTVNDNNNNPIDMSGSNVLQSEFDIYNSSDVTFVEGKGYVPNEGALPIQDKLISNNTIKYNIPVYNLNSSEIKSYDYVLLFKSGVSSSYSNANLSLLINFEAKQNSNTNNDTWKAIKTEKII